MELKVQELEARGNRAAVNEAYARVDVAGIQRNLDQVLTRMGLKDLDAFELVRRLSEQILPTYVDPSQSVQFNMLSARFSMTLTQLGMVYTSQYLRKARPQDVSDIRLGAPDALANKHSGPGRIQQIVQKTWADFQRINLGRGQNQDSTQLNSMQQAKVG
jgi:hypothetical protein